MNFLKLLFILLLATGDPFSFTLVPNTAHRAIQSPTLKWQHGGCYSSWCETGWYSSPAVTDLDGDGNAEVIGSPYTIFVLDGASGELKWQMASGHDRSETAADSVGRTWPGIVVADIDGDHKLEIVTAHSGGYVSVYDNEGYFKDGWPQHPISNEFRGLSVFDLDNDGRSEVIGTGALGSKTNTWVYEPDGSLRSGWPQLDNDSGYAWGVYNANASMGDIDADNQAEIIVPSDVHYICAYEADGSQISANAIYSGKGWGKVGIWEDPEPELRGWGACDGVRSESYRTNFADGASVIADVNGDGANEVIATGNVYDCDAGYPPSRYTGVYIFNADRSRFQAGAYDWTTGPVDTGAPLIEDYNEIETVEPNPAPADLDGDGNLEILFSAYDGRLHAFWLDKTEHGNWPYEVTDASEGFVRFSSEPLVADLDLDGKGEVIFTTWTEKGSNHTGRLHILNANGLDVVTPVDLPAAFGSSTWNGALPAPTLANIDNDADLEIVINTAHSGLAAYDLPGSAGARILWGTGRGNFQRSGSSLEASLERSSKTAAPLTPKTGEVVTYTITLANSGAMPLSGVRITDTLPATVQFSGGLWASSGKTQEQNGTITWGGEAAPATPVIIRFQAVVSDSLGTQPQRIVNSAEINDGQGNIIQRAAAIFANAGPNFIPLIQYR